MSFVRTRIRTIFIAFLAALALFLAIPLMVQLAMSRFIYTAPPRAFAADAAIVLGASVVRGQPSPLLAARAQEAVELYQSGAVPKILVTGDNGALSHDEVTPVRKYLLTAGIPAKDIFLDHAGFDTYSSMYRAYAVFSVRRAIIVTQGFHMPRALFIARSLGIDAVGVVADEAKPDLYQYVREIPASWKALLNLLFGRVPKYLGPAVLLSGDGQGTWY